MFRIDRLPEIERGVEGRDFDAPTVPKSRSARLSCVSEMKTLFTCVLLPPALSKIAPWSVAPMMFPYEVTPLCPPSRYIPHTRFRHEARFCETPCTHTVFPSELDDPIVDEMLFQRIVLFVNHPKGLS